MGRTYLAENNVQTLIDNIVVNYSFAVGLVIGQLPSLSDKDYVVHMAVTPQPEATSEQLTSKPPTSLDDIDPHYVALHARQVQRMLTGGLDIVGLFAVTGGQHDSQSDRLTQSKLRQIIYCVFTSLSKNTVSGPVNQHKTRLLLQICPASKKLTCRTYDVSDPKCAASPAEWKYQKTTSSFLVLKSTYSLDVVFPIGRGTLGDCLENQMMSGLIPVCESVWTSRALVNGQFLANESSLASRSSPNSRGARKRQQETLEEIFLVDLLQEMSPVRVNVPVECVECGAKMHVRGTINSRAFVNGKASVADAIEALKTDIVRSMLSRCELLCEDLLQAEEEQDEKVLYELPVRVYVRVCGIEFCDYVFQDETTDDSINRFKELLGLDVSSDSLEQTVETLPVDEDIVRPVKLVRKRRTSIVDVTSLGRVSTMTLCNILGIASVITMASVAAVVSYWYSVQ